MRIVIKDCLRFAGLMAKISLCFQLNCSTSGEQRLAGYRVFPCDALNTASDAPLKNRSTDAPLNYKLQTAPDRLSWSLARWRFEPQACLTMVVHGGGGGMWETWQHLART